VKRASDFVVWAVWAVMLLAALACIARWGRNIPLAEDWLMVPAMTGHEASIPEWLWAQNNEHRVALPKLLYLGLLRLTGDFRIGMLFNAFALAGLAAALAFTARRIRGGIMSLSDVLFPVALLHIGNWENLVWGWQLQFVLSVTLTGTLLVAIVRDPLPPRGMLGVAAGTLLLLPLSGANGLIMTLALAPWLLTAAAARRHDFPVTSRLAIAAACMAVALVALYFVDYVRPTWNAPSPGPVATLKTALKVLGFGFGPAVNGRWALAVAGAVLIGLPAVLLAARLAVRRDGTGPDRIRAFGVTSFLCGTGVLALAIGWGRAAGMVETNTLPDRYALLAVPALLGAYLALELYAPRNWGAAGQAAVATAFVLLLPWNTEAGFRWRDWYVAGMQRVENDLADGVPRAELARRHRSFLLHWNEELLRNDLALLRAAGVGPFERLRERGPEPIQ
jgi:hypothetical protein